MVPPYSDRIPRVPPYSSSSQQVCFRVRDYHPVPSDFPDRSTNTQADSDSGLLPVRSPLLGESRLISFPRGIPFCGPMRASAPMGRAELAPNTCIPGPGFGSCAVDNDSARTKGGNSCHPGKYSAAGSGRKSRIPVRLQFHIYTSLSLKTILCKKCIKCNMQFLHDIC